MQHKGQGLATGGSATGGSAGGGSSSQAALSLYVSSPVAGGSLPHRRRSAASGADADMGGASASGEENAVVDVVDSGQFLMPVSADSLSAQ